MRSKALLVAALLFSGCHHSTLHKKEHVDTFSKPLHVVESHPMKTLLGSHAGVVALLREGSDYVQCSHVAACNERVVPASTFKVPHALIALETGVVADADFVIPWDGVTREIAAWNHDHSLRSAIEVSAVWYFQEVARRIGPDREADWVKKLNYGNADTGEPSQVDRFWLDGPLAVTPLEQIAFLQRLARNELPVQPRSSEIVRDIIKLGQQHGAVLRGKTGWFHPHQADEAGWFVGYSERGHERTYVVVSLRRAANTSDADFLAQRRDIGEQALKREGAW